MSGTIQSISCELNGSCIYVLVSERYGQGVWLHSHDAQARHKYIIELRFVDLELCKNQALPKWFWRANKTQIEPTPLCKATPNRAKSRRRR